MHQGIIMQEGPPTVIYDRPTNEFVANFIGTTNMVEGLFQEAQGKYSALMMPGGLSFRGIVTSGDSPTGPGKAIIRPEKIHLTTDADPSRNCLKGRIEHCVFLGMQIHYIASTEAGRFSITSQNMGGSVHASGSEVILSWEFDSTLLLPAEVKP